MSRYMPPKPRFSRLLPAVALLLCLCVGVTMAQQDPPDGAAPSRGADEAAAVRESLPPELQGVLDKLDAANERLEDLAARVTYEREIPLLEEKQKARGEVIFKKPGRIVLKLGKPRNEDVYTDGKTWWLVSHRDKKVEVYKAAKEGEGGREAAFLDFAYGSSSKKLLKDYSIELTGTEQEDEETTYRLTLTPRPDEDRPAMYECIEVEVSDRLWLPHVLVLHEKGGEVVHTYNLSKVRTNTGIKDEAFVYEPPSDYTVVPVEQF